MTCRILSLFDWPGRYKILYEVSRPQIRHLFHGTESCNICFVSSNSACNARECSLRLDAIIAWNDCLVGGIFVYQ